LLAAALIAVLACVIIQGVVGSIFRAKVAAALKKSGIELEAGIAWYIPPLGVSLHHVRLSRVQPDGSRLEFFRASRVVLKSGSIPKAGNVLIITRLTIDSPVVQFVARTPAPGPIVVAAPASFVATPVMYTSLDASDPKARPSDRFEVHQMDVSDGRISYTPHGGGPIVVEHINAALGPAGDSMDLYHFTLDADANPVSSGRMTCSGSINSDDSTVAISEFSIHANVGAVLSQLQFLPSSRSKLDTAQADGTLDIHASASMPLHDWRHAVYQGHIQLQSAKVFFPRSNVRVDKGSADIHFDNASDFSGMHVTCAKFQATAGQTQLVIDACDFVTNTDGQTWQLGGLRGRLDVGEGIPALDRCHLKGRFVFTGAADGPMQIPKDKTALSVIHHELTAYPRDVSIQPPKYPIPVQHITGGPITFHAGVVRFANLMGDYGGDRALLDDAHITLDDPRQRIELSCFQKQVRIDGISGTLICRQPGPMYPAKLGLTVAQLRPSGSFAIGGGSWYAINRKLSGETAKPKPDYFFRVSTSAGAFHLTDHKFPLTNIKGDATVSPMLVNITALRGQCFGGTAVATAKITPVKPVHYEGLATFYNANLEMASRQLELKLKKPLIGQMYLQAQVSGVGKDGPSKPIESFSAEGELEVVQGNFGDISVIREAAHPVTRAQDPLTGHAAGTFAIHHQIVTLENCVVGNNSFGLQGSGTIGFDKRLDLNVVAAPLGDWALTLKQGKVLAANSPGADIVRGIQQLFSGAQQALLYDIHVTGTTTAPTVTVVLAPAITEPVAALFGLMITANDNTHLIDQIRSKKEK
jgi:hypothetical protein